MDIDVTFLFQMGLLLATLVTLNGLLLKPYLKVIEEREARIGQKSDDAEALRREGDQAMEQYQAQMRKARVDADRERETLREQGRSEERRMLAEARAEIAEAMNKARAEVGAAELEAKKHLSADTAGLARQLVAKVLDREVRA